MGGFFDPEESILEARADAESLMIDSCRITRPGEVVTDPNTGKDTRSQTPVYEGKCRVQQTVSQSSSSEAGGHLFSVQDSGVHIPVGAGPVQSGDMVLMLVVRMDPSLENTVFRVTDIAQKSLASAQRLRVEEVTS